MTWNYRVLKRENEHTTDPDEKYYYGIHEVYYRKNNKIKLWTIEPIIPYGSSVEELKECLNLMLKDSSDRPVLEEYTNILGQTRLREIKEKPRKKEETQLEFNFK